MKLKERIDILSAHELWVLSKGKEGQRANLFMANLQRANMKGANLQGANLQGANLTNTNLEETNLTNANLQEVNLYKANLRYATFTGANLLKANFKSADLNGAYFYNTRLFKADFTGANLHGTKLSEANLCGVIGAIYIYSQYEYECYGYMYQNILRVRLGCYDRAIKTWDSDFWNNNDEFLKDSPKGKNRLMVYKFIKKWLIANYPELR